MVISSLFYCLLLIYYVGYVRWHRVMQPFLWEIIRIFLQCLLYFKRTNITFFFYWVLLVFILRGKVNVVRSQCNLNALIWGKNPNVIFSAIINTLEAVEEQSKIIWLQDIFMNFFSFNVYKPTRNYNCIFELIKKSQCTHY